MPSCPGLFPSLGKPFCERQEINPRSSPKSHLPHYEMRRLSNPRLQPSFNIQYPWCIYSFAQRIPKMTVAYSTRLSLINISCGLQFKYCCIFRHRQITRWKSQNKPRGVCLALINAIMNSQRGVRPSSSHPEVRLTRRDREFLSTLSTPMGGP